MRSLPLHQAALGILWGNIGSEPDLSIVQERSSPNIDSPNHEITLGSHPRDYFSHSFSSPLMRNGRVQFTTISPDIDKKYKNFSSIETVDTPTYNSVANGILSGEFLTCGFSLTLTLPNNIYNTSY